MIIDVVKIMLPAALAFTVGIAITPVLTHFLYKHRMWKKHGVQVAIDGGDAPISRFLHNDENKKTPRMGGIVIWASSFITIMGIWSIALLFPNEITGKLDFLSRNQTWIPLFTLLSGALVGLLDDFLEVRGKGNYAAGGLSLKYRLFVVFGISLFVGSWLYIKLGVETVGIPFYGDVFIGAAIIPFFILVSLALYAGGVIDGIDGLSGGVFASIFMAYAGIAFHQGQINLAAFSAMLAGSVLAFLWFNIPPARFYMTETGTMGLTLTLAVIAFMTDSLAGGKGVAVLPIIAFPLLITVASDIIQVASKRWRGKKVFLVAPLHHHFEALGWPSYKVSMRYWILSIVFAVTGMIVAFIG